MPVLYVQHQGAVVRWRKGRLLVEHQHQVLQAVRAREIERIVLLGHVQVTSEAVASLLNAGVDLVYLSFTGRYRGRLTGAESKNIFRRLAQFRRFDDASFRLNVATRIVESKILNARQLVVTYTRNHNEVDLSESIDALEKAATRIGSAAELPVLLGLEGDAAKTYFHALGKMVRIEFSFEQRSRRPPRDPVNALLSFGYQILLGEVVGALVAEGLDPDLGFYHEPDYGRPSLALDLLEEFRPSLIDRFTLSLVNRNVLIPSDFENGANGGMFLKDEPRKRYLRFYERLMTTPAQERQTAKTETPRDVIRRQARSLSRAITGEDEYMPYRRTR